MQLHTTSTYAPDGCGRPVSRPGLCGREKHAYNEPKTYREWIYTTQRGKNEHTPSKTWFLTYGHLDCRKWPVSTMSFEAGPCTSEE